MTTANEKRDRFKRLATLRTKNVLRTLRVLGNCSNGNAYEYTDKEIDVIFSAVEKQLRNTKSRFQTSIQKKMDFKL